MQTDFQSKKEARNKKLAEEYVALIADAVPRCKARDLIMKKYGIYSQVTFYRIIKIYKDAVLEYRGISTDAAHI